MYRINGSVHWQHDQHVSIDLYEDYEVTSAYFKCEASCHISSTVQDIPSISAQLKHNHNETQVDSNLHIMVYMIRSSSQSNNFQFNSSTIRNKLSI